MDATQEMQNYSDFYCAAALPALPTTQTQNVPVVLRE